jgi:hypothetical protein
MTLAPSRALVVFAASNLLRDSSQRRYAIKRSRFSGVAKDFMFNQHRALAKLHHYNPESRL